MTDRLPGIAIRPAVAGDRLGVWAILEPMLRAGDTYALPGDWSADDALTYWFGPEHQVFVAEDGGVPVGVYYLQANQKGGGAHVANCGYVTATHARRKGVARAMCLHSLTEAARQGFRAMQFNFVISTNVHAVELWRDLGFEVVGQLPRAFQHPQHGFVDALVFFKSIDEAS